MAVGTGAAGTAMAVPLFQPSGARNPGKYSENDQDLVRKGTECRHHVLPGKNHDS